MCKVEGENGELINKNYKRLDQNNHFFLYMSKILTTFAG